MKKKDQVIEKCKALFGTPEYVLRSPGRANIIGEHVDYCEGYVLPFSIHQSMYFAARKNDKNLMRVHALDLNESFTMSDLSNSFKGWQKYFVSLKNILDEGHQATAGFDIVFGSDIPIGGGVSSSSALCCGLVALHNEVNNLSFSGDDIIDLASRVEHGIGLKGGLMDQTAIVYGREGNAILIDCKNHSKQHIPLELGAITFVLIDSNVKHSLVESDYNKRRTEVENGLLLVRKKNSGEVDYRNITDTQIDTIRLSDPIGYKRLKHVKSENTRVLKAIDAISNKEYNRLGQLISLSHISLKDDYEVSCEELDFIVDKLKGIQNVLGSRMMGGGFGGNVIALVDGKISSVQWTKLYEEYKNRFGTSLTQMEVSPSNGITFL